MSDSIRIDTAQIAPATRDWQRPTLTKLSLDQTLLGGGSDVDGDGGEIIPV